MSDLKHTTSLTQFEHVSEEEMAATPERDRQAAEMFARRGFQKPSDLVALAVADEKRALKAAKRRKEIP